jgi:hypothetical protein
MYSFINFLIIQYVADKIKGIMTMPLPVMITERQRLLEGGNCFCSNEHNFELEIWTNKQISKDINNLGTPGQCALSSVVQML